MTYVARTGPWIANLGTFATLAELKVTHPATLYDPGTCAYCLLEGEAQTNGAVWLTNPVNNTPFAYGAVGDGVADDTTAVQACATSGYCVLPPNTTFKVTAPIQIPSFGTFVGAGSKSIISGSSVTGGIVQIGYSGSANIYNTTVGNFQISGVGTNALRCQNVVGGSYVYNITVQSTTYTDAFWFATFFGNVIDNLSVFGIAPGTSDFHFDGGFNANVCNGLYVAASFCTYNFYMQNDVVANPSTGNTFNAVTAQGGVTGLYVGNGFSACVFNGFYDEGCVFPLVLGNYAGSKLTQGITFNSPCFFGPLSNQTSYASRVACIDFNYCQGVTLNSPYFGGSYLVDTIAPLTFSTSGSTTSAKGFCLVNAAGVPRAVVLIYGGIGYTGTPTVSVGGLGSSCVVTATESGGFVTALTLTTPGSGYTGQPLMPATFTTAYNCTIANPYFDSGAFLGGLGDPLWPWIVRSSTAPTTIGINITGDTAVGQPGTGWTGTADFKFSGGNFANQHYVSWLTGSGVGGQTLNYWSVVPPVFP